MLPYLTASLNDALPDSFYFAYKFDEMLFVTFSTWITSLNKRTPTPFSAWIKKLNKAPLFDDFYLNRKLKETLFLRFCLD